MLYGKILLLVVSIIKRNKKLNLSGLTINTQHKKKLIKKLFNYKIVHTNTGKFLK